MGNSKKNQSYVNIIRRENLSTHLLPLSAECVIETSLLAFLTFFKDIS